MTPVDAQSKDVVVVIPVRNGAWTIARAINSVLNQSLHSVEIIVVANGCTDNTVSIVKQFGSKVTLIEREKANVYEARRAGVEATNARAVMFLDADDELERHSLKRAWACMRKENADIVQLKMLQIYRLTSVVSVMFPFPCRYDCSKLIEGAIGDVRSFNPGMLAKLYRREILADMPAIGYEGFWGEDRLFHLHLFTARQIKVAYCSKADYLYTWGGGSRQLAKPDFEDEVNQVYALICDKLKEDNLEEYLPMALGHREKIIHDIHAAHRKSAGNMMRNFAALCCTR